VSDPGYPRHREADVALRDGSTIHVRPVRPDDLDAVAAFFRGLSGESRWFRFFSGFVDTDRAARSSVDVDYADRYALVTTFGPDAEVVGHAIYLTTAPGRAEIAFAVADAFQGRGVATILLAHLAEVAADRGIETFTAEILPQNHRMIEVFRQSGFQVEMKAEPGLITIAMPTELSEDAQARFHERERISSIAAIRGFLAPRSVAVIGASRNARTISGSTFHNILAKGFNGPVYPVNPKAEVVQSVVAYPSVEDIPGDVDLGVVVVPSSGVLEVARQCERKGVRSLVVITSGFAEVGPEGRELERELLDVCREAGMRLIGPNCMGILNTADDVSLAATFSPIFPPPGRVGFLSQSGALGLAVIDYASHLGLGMSSFVSVGNKADISGNDLLQYWEVDEDTDLILLYLESFGNPRSFARIARRVGRSKPIIAVKSGRSGAGVRATSSHTGALIAASDVTVDALFRQAGVIRVDTLGEMFDVATLLAHQPPPQGNRVAIVTNAGGPGILAADACEANGLRVDPPDEATQRALRDFLPTEASVGNPVDMIASATAEHYQRAIEVVGAQPDVDAVIVIFIRPLTTLPEDVAHAIHAAVDEMERKIPVLAVFMTSAGVPPELRRDDVHIPSYTFPEDAARALARAVRYGEWLHKPEGTVSPVPTGECRAEATSILAEALSDGGRWLKPDEIARLFACYDLPLAEWRLASTPEEAGAAADELGGQVALKAVAEKVVHKTEAGAVRLGLEGADAVRVAATDMAARVHRSSGAEVERFLVQRMVPQGVEMLVGVVHDASFGPVVAVGAGGTAVELLKDVQVRITPLTDVDAREMVGSLQTFPLLDGYRGAPKADVPALEQFLLRLSALVDAHPAIAEMDCNPVMVLPEGQGALIVDARVRVEPATPTPPLAARRRP
jgi:acetyl coenzyme A synthetase (ADP forming)-like protein